MTWQNLLRAAYGFDTFKELTDYLDPYHIDHDDGDTIPDLEDTVTPCPALDYILTDLKEQDGADENQALINAIQQIIDTEEA